MALVGSHDVRDFIEHSGFIGWITASGEHATPCSASHRAADIAHDVALLAAR